jgi:hypothetical protein
MAKFYFHIRDATGRVLDNDGSDCASMAEALQEAEASARKVARYFLEGRKSLNDVFVDIEDAERRIVATLAVSETAQLYPRFAQAAASHSRDAATADETLAHDSRKEAQEREVQEAREAAEEVRWRAVLADLASRKF